MKILTCVKKGSEIKVAVDGEEGFVQFPKDLREEGKKFAVDGLKKVKTHWVVEGVIYELNPVAGKVLASEKSYYQVTEENDSEGETWNFFIDKSMTNATELVCVINKYIKLTEESGSEYSLSEVTQKEVDQCMKKKDRNSYMSEYNIVQSINLPSQINKKYKEFSSLKESDSIGDYLYKGKCFNR